jgi:ligand-binding sensor domain-containing protein
MNLKHYALFLLFSGLIFTTLFSQPMKIGDWRTHLPYQRVIDTEIVGQDVFAATPSEIFIYNKQDNSLRYLNKINGLNDVGIKSIRYSAAYQTMVVAYTNTNIDLVKASQIININDIRNKEIIGNKVINSIFLRDQYAYLSCGFGIVVLDLVREEIHDTYLIGPQGSFINVFDLDVFDNTFYAATEAGVYYASVNSPNLADFNQWTKDMRLIHPNLRYTQIERFQDKLYLNYSRNVFNTDTLFVFNGSNWDYFDPSNTSIHPSLRAYSDRFLVVNNYNIFVYNQNMELLHSVYAPEGLGIEPQAAAMDSEGNVWIGDRRRGLIKSFNNGFSGEFILPNGPSTTNVYELKARGENVWVAPGGRRNDWGKTYMTDGVFSYVDGLWKSHNTSNASAFDSISDMVSVAIDPLDHNTAYIGTWQSGIMVFTNNVLTDIYSEHNSTLQGWVAAPELVNISGLDFDSFNNLWVANTGAPNLLSMRTPGGEWRSFNLGASASGSDIANMIVDKSNHKWIIRRAEGMLMVFKDNNTFDNPADDQLRILSSSPGNGNIPGNTVFSMAVDHDGAVWVGTDAGPAVFYSPDRIFQQGVDFDAQQILVPRNDGTGQADYLLGSEKILSIAIDGANRKWFGTENGVFLMSKDGLEEIFHFNTMNSPLLSNTVNSIAIMDNGEVFFGTSNGIISFKSTATPGGEVNNDVYAYPNPVRPEYTGPVAVKGLVRDALVKFTDVSGKLVYETRALGGQAVWDGRTINGSKVKPGVYLVFVSDNDGIETLATKILMMR